MPIKISKLVELEIGDPDDAQGRPWRFSARVAEGAPDRVHMRFCAMEFWLGAHELGEFTRFLIEAQNLLIKEPS